ncbi:citrulline utilization hydrolase CtlX [Fulvivirga lutea]|uniref:Amidinotransferase n=1 Tax=Fulvivirga lutea TaxID=2810512 RepID=A0A974WF43_9BACT|nr:arginine deiminase-related protein [Fulvivirga lutea]QSE95837.1 amidinotransferase [Fulvivirga lutea]
MAKQITDTILMIRPARFRMNEQTALNNYYQRAIENLTAEQIQEQALGEFDSFVEKLRSHLVEVIVVEDTLSPDTPDSIFPNNWISFHEDGRVGIYPMYAENRRQERRSDIIEKIRETHNVKALVDFTEFESSNQFLEGTGSMILDRVNKLSYAALSERTNSKPLEDFCKAFGYEAVTFVANQTVDNQRKPIYHTNVMMCVAEDFCIICLESIDNVEEKQQVVSKLKETNKEIIEITEGQKLHFAGNMLQVRNREGKPFLIMSQAAYRSLEPSQIKHIEKYCSILYSSLDTIEALGGGSARCMMAEIFLPKRL